MNDSVNVKSVTTAGTTTTFGTGVAFNRVASPDSKTHLRRALENIGTEIGVQRTATLRVAHVPRSSSNGVQRTLMAFDIERSYYSQDADSNYTIPTGITRKSRVAVQADIPEGMTQAEFLNDFRRLIGTCIDDSEAIAKALYNAEI